MEAGIMSGAKGGNRDLPDTQCPSLFGQMRSEVNASLATLRDRLAKGICYLITYFIT